jgi:hypothetical protein
VNVMSIGQYNATLPTVQDGKIVELQVTSRGELITGGPVADDAAASGNPVPVGGIYNTTLPTYANLDRTQLQTGDNGSINTQIRDDANNLTAQIVAGADALANGSAIGLGVVNRHTIYDSAATQWNRGRQVVTGTDSTGTGIAAAGILAQLDDTSMGTVTENQFGNLRMSANRGLVTSPYATPEESWLYAAAAAGILNTTTAVTFKAAAGAGLRNYITSIDLFGEVLTTATEVAVRDGAAGTVIWRTKIATTGLLQGRSITFPRPLRGTANTLLEVVTLSASGAGAVYFNAAGYVAP